MVGDLFAPTHIILLLVVMLLVFGPKRLPDLGRSLGKGLRELKTSLAGEDDETRQPAKPTDENTSRAAAPDAAGATAATQPAHTNPTP